ncbi:hypothetical protein VNO78_23205 [Psophocarpus tetragonolobus]|uniref:Uncharacterized protein n=1 Tax=Psophocarpus tetragonolobus TaxID=3891 RepID=A0AAN9S663_PSOTE
MAESRSKQHRSPRFNKKIHISFLSLSFSSILWSHHCGAKCKVVALSAIDDIKQSPFNLQKKPKHPGVAEISTLAVVNEGSSGASQPH